VKPHITFREIAKSLTLSLEGHDQNRLKEARRLLASLSEKLRYEFHFAFPETFDAIEYGIRKDFVSAITEELEELKEITEEDIRSIEEDVKEYEES